ncbi:hypothetical protein M758_UG309000 [Ceratodon purpureus]|nr:hypothetical protein M758_UG309000 [Ceratodon purpureus]
MMPKVATPVWHYAPYWNTRRRSATAVQTTAALGVAGRNAPVSAPANSSSMTPNPVDELRWSTPRNDGAERSLFAAINQVIQSGEKEGASGLDEA